MELVYAYIDKYKCIEKRELNLSSFYNVNKNGDRFYIEKSDISRDFYDDRIDIIALFGKNGTGKSTTLELLAKILSSECIPESDGSYNVDVVPVNDFNVFLIFEENKRLYYYASLDDVYSIECSFCNPIELYIEDLFLEKRNIVKFSHVIEPLAEKEKISNNKNFRYIDCSNSGLISRSTRSEGKNKDIASTFELLNNHNISMMGDALAPMVGTIDVTKDIKSCCRKISRKLSYLIRNFSNINRGYDKSLVDFLRETLLEVITKYDSNSRISKEDLSEYPPADGREHLYAIYQSMLEILANPEVFYLNYKKVDYVNHIFKFNLFSDVISHVIDEAMGFNEVNDCIIYFFNNVIYNHKASLIDIIRDCGDFSWMPFGTNDMDKYRGVDNEQYNIWQFSSFINRFNDSDDCYFIRFYVDSYDELLGVNEILVNYKGMFTGVDIRWNGISSGQYSLLNMFSRLNEHLQFDEVNYVFIDEGEVYLHPEWQRNYIDQLVDFYKRILSEHSRVKIIITSHSPMVLSDLPKESTNFFGYRNEDNRSFFGANFYDLYSDGFTVNKTMGEFAFKKIKKLSADVKKGANRTELRTSIEMLGDPFIKQVLTESLDTND
ncbi:AAA family ATPase [Vibrio fortis]|uniref:AAA family ATPase n=1 Tax=Vibrio fortis TaxID=212667 RepID=UPI0040691777